LTYSKNDSDDALRHDQLRLFLGGEGGTGKSRVLDAVQALCESWNRSDCLVKTALTGKAATMINGRTLASFLLQLRYRRNLSSAIYIDVLVIDEVSMMRKAQLAQLDKLLRIAKRVPGVLFGGVHIVLVGDFLQLPPVGGEPLYKDPSWSRRQTPTSWPGLRCGGGLIT
jgi:ATP-dependent DNA helicase PIF1